LWQKPNDTAGPIGNTKFPDACQAYKVAGSEATYCQHVANCSNNQTFYAKSDSLEGADYQNSGGFNVPM
jgi:hypothetical protein